MDKVAVLGAGNSGLATSAHLALNGCKVNLWNRSHWRVEGLLNHPVIQSIGAVEGQVTLNKVTQDIGEAVDGAGLIMITTPATAHKNIAKLIAPYVDDNAAILLNPGRTLGAWDFEQQLLNAGMTKLPVIAETQTIVYTCRCVSASKVEVLTIKKNVPFCCVKSQWNKVIFERLPVCLKQKFIPANSIIETSLGNVGMLLHCIPMILNAGWVENEKKQFRYYYDAITPSVSKLIETLDKERIAVGKSFNTDLPSLTDWFKTAYGVDADSIYRAIKSTEAYRTIDAPDSLKHRYLTEDIPFGLVPLEQLAKASGIETKLTTLTIDIADALLNRNFRREGRQIGDFLNRWSNDSI